MQRFAVTDFTEKPPAYEAASDDSWGMRAYHGTEASPRVHK